MRKLTFVLLGFFLFSEASAQIYDASKIAPAMKERARAVVRMMDMNIKVNDLNNVTYIIKGAVTILNKNGEDEARIAVWYNKTRQIRSIKGTIYDEAGLPVRKFTEKNFEDVSAANNSSLFEDSRIKSIFASHGNYPYTVEYEYEIRSKQSLIFPDWNPGNAAGISVENSRLTFICKPDFNLRYKQINYPGKGEQSSTTDGDKQYTWELKNLKALKEEPYSQNPDEYLPAVKLAPEKFMYENLIGSFSNWENYGSWTYDILLKGRDQIPQETAGYVKEMVSGISDPKLKAKKIYEYVQQKMRYVSVQIGIGGYQPITASEVDRTSYGDCKGLVNYTKGLLAVAGIESWYVLVEAGDYKTNAIADFASMNQFNHAILCIPFANDTTWIDCTSKTLPFGYLGDFTDDRLALACTKDGGKLIRTPKLSAEENMQIRKGSFIIDVDGNLSGEMNTSFTGWQYGNRDMLINDTYPEQLKKLAKIYTVNNLEVKGFTIRDERNSKPATHENIKFSAREYCFINNDLLTLSLNQLNKARFIKEVSNRMTPLYINRGYTDSDELTYVLPPGYKVEGFPKNVLIEKPFGRFSMNLEIKGNTAIYTRNVILKDGVYSPEMYEQLVDFYRKAADADEAKIIFTKKLN